MTLLILITLFSACSESESINNPIEKKYPTNIKLPIEKIKVGDTIIIQGNFLKEEVYIITFSDNLVAEITETTKDYLKVKVPEKAVTGDVTLTYEGKTEVIGRVEFDVVDVIIDGGTVFYGVMGTCNGNGSTANLVEINIENGSTKIVSNANLYKAQSIAFNPNTSEMYFSDFTTDTPRLMKVNVDSGEEKFMTITYQNDFCHLDDLLYNQNNNKLYGVTGTCNGNGSTANLVEINLENGNTTIVSNANLYKAQSITFNPDASDVYFSDFTTDVPRLMKVNLDSGEEKFVNIVYQNDFCHLDDLFYNQNNNKLYGVTGTCNGNGSTANLVEINIENGSTTIVSDTNLYKAQSLTFNLYTSELYFSDFTADLPKLLKLDINTGESSLMDVTYQNDFCHLDELLIINK
ncbi:TolB-like translocation protein [Tenacibaculum ovolyticum]|uniref:hypothetical protein n=1 Tax=Tenacibaculum ovolyticum TaxID=104270 RepID=UPI001F1F947A|nr:hypothetical protein [Tenacibaculum ovolyticum]